MFTSTSVRQLTESQQPNHRLLFTYKQTPESIWRLQTDHLSELKISFGPASDRYQTDSASCFIIDGMLFDSDSTTYIQSVLWVVRVTRKILYGVWHQTVCALCDPVERFSRTFDRRTGVVRAAM